ncbi:MAG: ribosome-associated translation inhibitor RaiA [Bacilli bacterium]
MKFLIRGEKIEITDSMKTYAKEKLQRLDKYIDRSDEITVNILVKVREHIHKVEATIPLRGFILRAEEEGKDFYAAFDSIIDILERQITKNKKRMQNKMHKERPIFSDFEVKEIFADEEIVKRKKVEVKPMDEDEAILQLELIDHQFYLYKDINTDKYAVIYKRKDGNYGVIEAE